MTRLRAFALFAVLLAGCGNSNTVSSTSSSTASGGATGSSSSSSGSSGTSSTSTSGGSGTTSSSSGSSGTSSSTGGSSGGDVDAGCRSPRDPDATRAVVVSHPYLADGGDSTLYEVMSLASDGTLTRTGFTFSMRASNQGVIAFTPDGKLGFAPQDDGSVGVFQMLDDGGVQVLNDGLSGFYASHVVMAADGMRAYVLDGDTLSNNGGVYGVDIACDGTLGTPTSLGTFNTPGAMAFLHAAPDQALVAVGDSTGSTATDDLFWADFASTTPTTLGNTLVFDGGAIPSDLAITEDDAYALVTDDGIFAGNRVGVAKIGPSGLAPVDVLPTQNPAGVVTSPFNNAALVLNSDGTDGLTLLSYDPSSSATPFTDKGHITYVGTHPQLPTEAVVIRRGALRGRVLIGELSGVRQVQFLEDGGAEDFSVDNVDGFDGIVGAMGVQP
ncbi:MAG: hypothetical protein JST54_10000 [Deltaproteobacteria bacterium]|nr:hypothetical protein [Deltaproteobacteria bacterium]